MNLELYEDVPTELVDQSEFFIFRAYERSVDAGTISCWACLSCIALDPWWPQRAIWGCGAELNVSYLAATLYTHQAGCWAQRIKYWKCLLCALVLLDSPMGECEGWDGLAILAGVRGLLPSSHGVYQDDCWAQKIEWDCIMPGSPITHAALLGPLANTVGDVA